MSEFKHMRSEAYFVPRNGGPPIIIHDLVVSYEEITEFLDLAGRVVRTERRVNGVLQEDQS